MGSPDPNDQFTQDPDSQVVWCGKCRVLEVVDKYSPKCGHTIGHSPWVRDSR